MTIWFTVLNSTDYPPSTTRTETLAEAFEHAGGILAMIIAVFVGLLLIMGMASLMASLGGFWMESLFVVLAIGIVVAGVVRFGRG